MKVRGFTIWQFIAALIIVVITALVLFPIFAKTRCKCPNSGCTSNEKLIGLALQQYAQDNDELMPNISDAPGSPNTWRAATMPYIKSQSVYQCPDREDKTLAPDGFPRSYAANYSGNYNGNSMDQGKGAFAGPGSKPISFSNVREPRNLITVCEVEGSNAPEFNIDDSGRFGPDKHILWAGHEHRANFIFADGHVKSFPPTKTARYPVGGNGYRNLWYRDETQPLPPSGVAILAEAEKRGADRP